MVWTKWWWSKNWSIKIWCKKNKWFIFWKGYLDAQVKEPFLDIDFASNQAKLDFFISEGEKYTTNELKYI